jgi:hypothetical protein
VGAARTVLTSWLVGVGWVQVLASVWVRDRAGTRAVARFGRHARRVATVVGWSPGTSSSVRLTVTRGRGVARVAGPVERKLATVVRWSPGANSGVRLTWTDLKIPAVGDAVVWVESGLSSRSSAPGETAGARRLCTGWMVRAGGCPGRMIGACGCPRSIWM